MKTQENVKQILYKYKNVLIFALLVLIILGSCVGGGDSYRSKLSYGDMHYYLEISSDRKKVRFVHTEFPSMSYISTNWVDIKLGGVGSTYASTFFEIKDKQFRIRSDDFWGNWANICGVDASYVKELTGAEYKVEVNNGEVRFCYKGPSSSYNWVCGNWVSFDKDYVCGPSCPEGYVYNDYTKKCEAEPICQNGIYDPSIKKCYIGDFTCPLGNYDCIKLLDGKRYCTNVPCGDVSNPITTFKNTDTPPGINDKKPDGQVDQNGNCLGTIYIFNGQDKRCRPPGTQTAFNDCCKKGEMSLLGLVNLGKCNADEQYLAKLREWGERDGRCHYVGEYCAEEWKLGFTKICVQKKKTYCCFSSPLARIIQEQGRQQLGISWGDPKAPNCRGFTPEEFQKIDWSKVDFSEWINNEVIPNIQQNLNNTLTNTIDQIKSNIQNKY